jgi:hypothetical protein
MLENAAGERKVGLHLPAGITAFYLWYYARLARNSTVLCQIPWEFHGFIPDSLGIPRLYARFPGNSTAYARFPGNFTALCQIPWEFHDIMPEISY